MKHKLLSLLALAGATLMSTSAMAQWTEPAVVEPALGEATTPEDGGVYFIYNPATDLYLGAGNNWGTHVVATTISDAYPAIFWDQAIALSGGETDQGTGQALAMKLTKLESGNWYIQHMGTNRGATYLSSEDGNSWIDCDNGRRIDFIFTETEGGYTIQASNTVEAGTYFGVGEGETAHEDYEMVSINVMNNIEAGERAVWQFIGTNYSAWQTYSARKAFYDLNQEVVASGYTVDDAAAKAVYDNANATVEQLEAAMGEYRRLFNKAKFQDIFAGASEDNPIDVTDDVLTNPRFDEATSNGQMPPGWNITITGQNLGQMNRTDTNPDTGLAITNFIEAWHPQALGDGVIAQTVYDMPKGKYVLECDASACHDPENGDGSDIVGVNLFIEAGSLKATTRIGTRRLRVTHYSVTFINDGSEILTFGLEANGTNANWLSADNFKITYYGETSDSPELATMKEALKQANALAEEVEYNNIESTDNNSISEEARQALSSAISAAESAESGSAEDQLAATAALNEAIAAVDASKKLYAQFKAIYNDGNATLNKLVDLNQWGDLQRQIEDYLEDDLRAKFDNGALTADMLEEYQNKVSQLVRDYISDPSKIHVGDDLTFLLVNPGFTTGTTANPTGWTINSGSMTELRAATHNIETFHKAFDLSQTLPNMPAGVYDVTLQGFARHDGADTDKTWLYGGISKEYLISLNDDENQMRDTPIYSADNLETYPNLGDGNYDNTATNGMYKANGMTGAYHWFNTLNPNTGENYYVNHVKVVLDHDGDLTIGIHCETTSDWVIFSNFGIKYAGMDASIFPEMVQKKQTELTTLVENIDAEYMGLAIADDVNKLVAEKLAIDANNIDNADDALAAIAEIDETIKKVNECAASYKQLGVVLEFFEARISETAHTPSEAYQTTVSKVRSNYDSGYAAADAIVADENALVEGWAASLAGTYEAGEEITEAILNPTYDGYVLDDGVYGAEFWESTVNPGVNYNECEFFNTAFTHSQTLRGLTPGYYTVAVDGFYRYGDYNANTDAGTPGAGAAFTNGEEVLNVEMFVQSSTGSTSEPMKSIFAGTQPDLLGVGSEVSPEGVDGYIPNDMNAASTYLDYGSYENKIDVEVGEDGVLTIGVRKSQGIVNDWAIFKNWKLTYLGTEAPVAVEGIEAQTAGNSAIYSIDGRQQNQLRRGINIVRQNGKVEKVLVK